MHCSVPSTLQAHVILAEFVLLHSRKHWERASHGVPGLQLGRGVPGHAVARLVHTPPKQSAAVVPHALFQKHVPAAWHASFVAGSCEGHRGFRSLSEEVH